ncbi:MAG: hypothetical protein AAF767_06130 [Pseudomonadota bacterium]
MNRLSLPAMVIFFAGAIGAMFLKDAIFQFDGTMEFIASAAAGAIGGLSGAIVGMIVFPKQRDKNE